MNLDVTGNAPEVEFVARIPSYKQVKSLFHAPLPDSAVVPVEVLIQNNGERLLTIHHPNELHLVGGFEGLSLEAGSTFYKPIRPVDAFAVFAGCSNGALKYRVSSNRRIAAGVIFPPFGVYVAYKEIRYGRLYRALIKKSLFPVLDCGLVKPIELAPGGEVRGFVYFKVAKSDLPYRRIVQASGAGPGESFGSKKSDVDGRGHKGRGVGRRSKYAEKRTKKGGARFNCADGYRLSLRACFSVNGVDTLAFENALAAERSAFRGGALGFVRKKGRRIGSVEGGVFFALSESGSKSLRGRLFVYPGRFVELAKAVSGTNPYACSHVAEFADSLSAVELRAASATLADCSSFGELNACAVNFKSSSKTLLWRRNHRFEFIVSRRFSRRTRRIFLTPDDLVVLSENGFLYLLPLDRRLKKSRYMKAGRDIDDAFVAGNVVYVFQKNGIVKRIELTGENALKITRRDTLPKGERRVIAAFRGSLIVMNIDRKSVSFSLDLFDTMSGAEREMMHFPGEAEFCSFDNGAVDLQLKDGTFLRLVPRGGGLVTERAMYVPFAVEAADFEGGRLTVIGKGGVFASRAAGDFEPGSIDIIEGLTKVRCFR